jgi:hydroxymethylpyrimidine pyrophosphatase-like HAD family hydrolase
LIRIATTYYDGQIIYEDDLSRRIAENFESVYNSKTNEYMFAYKGNLLEYTYINSSNKSIRMETSSKMPTYSELCDYYEKRYLANL